MPSLITTGSLSTRGFGFPGQSIIYIPASGSITQYFNLAYNYGNPSILSWTVTGTTFNFTISSATSSGMWADLILAPMLLEAWSRVSGSSLFTSERVSLRNL